MTVEVNIVFREKPDALVVPAEAIVDSAISVVNADRTSRVRVATGVRGARLVEVSGDLAEGAMVVSPARTDLRDGTAVRVDLLPDTTTKANPGDGRPAIDDNAAPQASAAPLRAAAGAALSEPDRLTEEVNQAISAALSARVLSIVNDARRKADDPAANR